MGILLLCCLNDENFKILFRRVNNEHQIAQGLANERLRDEILCQLVNQTWRNDVEGNNERGWLLMASCLSAFPPTGPLYKYLLK